MPKLHDGDDDEWRTGLFDCGEDIPGCFDVVLCWPCQYGRMCHSLTSSSSGGANEMDFKWCLTAFFLMPCCVHGLTFGFRGKLRERFHIVGGCPGDFFASFCCTACATCQHFRELTNYGHWPGGSLCAREQPGGHG